MKICSRCKKEKPLDEFGIMQTGRDGHRPECKECFNRWKRERKASAQGWRGPRGRTVLPRGERL